MKYSFVLHAIAYGALVPACSLQARYRVIDSVDAPEQPAIDAVTEASADGDDARSDSDGGPAIDAPCASGATLCGARCVNLDSDPLNCGACASACPTGASGAGFACVSGRCVGGCDAGTFVGDASAGRCVRAPRPISPMSGSFLQGSSFEVRYADAPADAGPNRVRLCADPLCMSEVSGTTQNIAPGSGIASFTLTAAQRALFTTGYVFWQLLNGQGESPVWSLRLIPDPTPAPSATMGTGRRARAAFGASADFTGDGIDDPIVTGELEGIRRLYVVTPNSMDGSLSFSAPLAFPSGASASLVLARAGDVNGDGYSDLAVGAQSRDRVLVFLGGPNLVSSAPIVLDVVGASAIFGSNIAAAGDLDRDGYGDLAIADESAGAGAIGAVYVYWGGPRGPSRAVRTQVPAAEGFAPGGRFGSGLVGACDVDGDGIHDLLVGAPRSSTPRVHIYRGGTRTFASERRLQPMGETRFGGAIGCLGDVDNDGDHEWVTETELRSGPMLAVYLGSNDPGDVSSVMRTSSLLPIGPEPVRQFLPAYDIARDPSGLGHLDLAFLGTGALGVSVNQYINDRSGRFGAVETLSLSMPAMTNDVTASILHVASGEPVLILGAPTVGTNGAVGAAHPVGATGFRQPTNRDFRPLMGQPPGATRVGEVVLR